MANRLPTVHIMTAATRPGDAISNYTLTLQRLLQQQGHQSHIYADTVDPSLAHHIKHTSLYQPTGQDLLWFHYSIYAPNLTIALNSPDYKLMDYHGISPPALFAGQDSHMAHLCQKGLDALPALHDQFNQYVVHTNFVRDELIGQGFPAGRIHTLPLCLDTSHFNQPDDPTLSQRLQQLDYLLFVGRLVPQKDLVSLIHLFAHLHQHKPNMALILVGPPNLPRYYQQLQKLVKAQGLTEYVIFPGRVTNPSHLAPLFRHATLTCVTSKWESFCVPIAESLHFGTPVAVCNTPPLPEVAGPAGIIFDKANPQQAAQTLLQLIDNPTRYHQLSQTARDWSQRYSDTTLAQNITQLLKVITHET